MKIKLLELANVVNRLKNVVGSEDDFSSILLSIGQSSLMSILGTDRIVSAKMPVRIAGDRKPGKHLVKFDKLAGYVNVWSSSASPDDIVNLTIKRNCVILSCGNDVVELATGSKNIAQFSKSFPRPKKGLTWDSVPDLGRMVKLAAPVADPKPTTDSLILEGVHFVWGEGKIVVEATDRYRYIRIDKPCRRQSSVLKCVVHVRGAVLFSNFEDNRLGYITIFDNRIFYRDETGMYSSLLFKDSYPDMMSEIKPIKNPTKIMVQAKDLKSALDRVGLIGATNFVLYPSKKKGLVKLSAKTSDRLYSFDTDLEVKTSGRLLPICLGVDHLKYLISFAGDKIILLFEGSEEPVRYMEKGLLYLSLPFTLPQEYQK